MPERRTWKTPFLLLLGAVPVSMAAVFAGGWYYSDSLKKGALEPNRDPSKLDLQVVALSEGRVTLRATSSVENRDWETDGVFGIEWPGGYAQAGAILEIADRQVVRKFRPMIGDLKPGDSVRLDSFAFTGDPKDALGIVFQDVRFNSPLGEMPAWFIEGTRDTWVIFVHGKGASRREALRMLPAVHNLGFPSLVITYRNDVEAPASDDGFYRYGQTEWEDLEAAAYYAVNHGAEKLILVGYSMGGAIVTSFLYESSAAARVEAVILDSPMLDFGATVDHGVRGRKLLAPVQAAGKQLAALRFDIDWDELNYLKRSDELGVPILLFHGDRDDRVPVETSDALAAARPDIVTFVRTPGVDHVRTWNADPAAYEAAVSDFLARVAPLP
jgi:pimeloyl-ACP methyl ester carboxylesterase